MGLLLTFSIKSAIGIIFFYLFYKLLMNRETFHRFNRIFLIFITLLAWLLPAFLFFKDLISKHVGPMMEVDSVPLIGLEKSEFLGGVVSPISERSQPIFFSIIILLYLVGIVCLLFINLYSFFSLRKLFASCRKEKTDSGKTLLIHNKEIAPFSWMRYIVVSEQDLLEHRDEILIHEEAHVDLKHFLDLILVNLSVCFQWFNPAMWLLRQELQTIHEFEADEQVLLHGINAKDYQLLLIKKAVGTHSYMLANRLTHSNLKKRITMMIKKRSNPWARLKYAMVLPLVAITISTFARPETKKFTTYVSNAKITDLFLESEIRSEEELKEKNPIRSSVSIEKELVAPTDSSVYTIVEKMPQFPGGMNALMGFLSKNTKYPESAQKNNIQGRVLIGFVIDKDGSVKNLVVKRGVDPALDAEALRVVGLMPKWEPGEEKGEKVAVNYFLPIVFKLSGKEKDTTFTVVEKMPQFPGGLNALTDFISKNTIYPASAQENNIQGRVIVGFVIGKDGSIRDIAIKRGVDPALDAAALRVVNLMPNWEPGEQKGKKVAVNYCIPVVFRLWGNEKDTTFTVVEKMPQFPGGLKALTEFLSKNTIYPVPAQENNIQGRVIVGFVIGKDGSIRDIAIKRGVDPVLDAEALRVVSLMPNWEPGEQRGEKVAVNYSLPVVFRLSGNEEDVPFSVVEKMPQFPGGPKALMEFISKNTKYPASAQKNNIQGRVIVGFVIDKDGSIRDIAVKRGVDPSLDAEALRVISLMPNWEPGEQKGEKVAVSYTLPVVFSVN